MGQAQSQDLAPGDPGFTGYGKHVGLSGESYEGVWLNGKPHGLGTVKLTCGSVYKGSFQKGHFHGYGKFTCR